MLFRAAHSNHCMPPQISSPLPRASPVAQTVKRLPAMRKTRVQSLGQEEPLEKEMAAHSSTLDWKVPKGVGSTLSGWHGCSCLGALFAQRREPISGRAPNLEACGLYSNRGSFIQRSAPSLCFPTIFSSLSENSCITWQVSYKVRSKEKKNIPPFFSDTFCNSFSVVATHPS